MAWCMQNVHVKRLGEFYIPFLSECVHFARTCLAFYFFVFIIYYFIAAILMAIRCGLFLLILVNDNLFDITMR